MKKLLPVLVFCTALGAQERSKPVDVEVKQVNDRRTNGYFAQLVLSLELPKVKSSDVAASRVLVASATDDSGRSLLDPERQEPQLEANASLGMMGDNEPRPATVSVTLKNPDRKATTVKEVRGEIELYMPSKDPNSVAEIAKFKTLAGKPLSHKALKANGIEISLLSPAQLEAERKKLAEAKRKELTAGGWEGESLDQFISSYLEGLLRLEDSDVPLRVKDPNQRIQEISYVTATGEVKRASMRTDEGLTILSTWSEPPQPDWKLRVSMKTPKNLVRHTFALNNVALP